MKAKRILQILLVVTLIVALPIAAAFDARTAEKIDRKLYKDIVNEDAEAIEEMQEKIPATYEEAETNVGERIHRYLMWTKDGEHIMWGNYGNGFFIGEDNLDKRAWGIYGKTVFAGFYDGEFFHGRYSRGRWKAVDLFGEEESKGRFVLFRNRPISVASNAE